MKSQYGKISGWGYYVPEKVLTNKDLEKIVDTNDEWIVQRTGIRTRHIAADHETTSTMSIEASKRAIAQAGLTPADIDLIIVATSTPDYLAPAVSSQIQHGLGCVDTPAFVMMTGCTGFVYALTNAYQFIHTGAYNRILVIGVELLSRFVDWNDRRTAVLFGDGAGAVVLEGTSEPCGLYGMSLGSDGSKAESIIFYAGGSAEPLTQDALDNGRQYLQMDGQAVFKFASRIVKRASDEALAQAGMTLDDIDWIIPHQANLRIIQAAARNMGVPLERFYITVDKYANVSAATVPIALCEGLESGAIKPDDNILFVAFGAGLTWAASVLQLNPTIVGQLTEVDSTIEQSVAALA